MPEYIVHYIGAMKYAVLQLNTTGHYVDFASFTSGYDASFTAKVLNEEHKRQQAVEDEPINFVIDPTPALLAAHSHVHVAGVCRKNRNGERCETTEA